MENNFGARVKAIRKELGLTQEEFATKLGFTGTNPRATVSNWENGKTTPAKMCQSISEVFGVSLAWLLDGTGSMFTNANKFNELAPSSYMRILPITDGPTLEINRNFAFEIQDNFTTIRYYKNQYDVMEPTSYKGDLLFVDISDKTPKLDSIYLLNVNGNFTLRRAGKTSGTITIFASDNPKYTSIEINTEKEPEVIVGKVIWLGRKVIP